MINIILWLLAALGLALILPLIVPFTYKAYIKKSDLLYVYGNFAWLFKAVKVEAIKESGEAFKVALKIFGRFDILLDSTKFNKGKEKDNKKNKKNKKKSSKGFNLDLIKGVISLAKEILIHIKPKRLYIKARIGFDDPSNTGILCALKYQFQHLIQNYEVYIEPVFDDEVLEGEIDIRGRLVVVSLIYYAIKAFWPFIINKTKNKIKNIRLMRKGNKDYVREY